MSPLPSPNPEEVKLIISREEFSQKTIHWGRTAQSCFDLFFRWKMVIEFSDWSFPTDPVGKHGRPTFLILFCLPPTTVPPPPPSTPLLSSFPLRLFGNMPTRKEICNSDNSHVPSFDFSFLQFWHVWEVHIVCYANKYNKKRILFSFIS